MGERKFSGSYRVKSIFLSAVLIGCVAFLPSVAECNALSLDGAGDRAQASATVFPDSGGLQSFTVEAWIYPTASAKYILTDDAFDLILFYNPGEANGGVGFKVYLYGPSTATEVIEYRDVALNQWNHVALMFDADAQPNPRITLAINGILSISAVDFTAGSFYTSTGQHFALGGLYNNGFDNFQGRIDEVRVSDIVRYTTHFSPPSTFAPDANTRGLWHFDETPGSTSFADSSGYGFTLSGVDNALNAAHEADTTPPVTTAAPRGRAYDAPQNVKLICADFPSGCDKTYYCVGAGCNPVTEYAGPIGISNSTDLRFYSTDNSANGEAVKTETYTVTQYYTLDMYVQGGGNGYVTSSPPGINCGYGTPGDCSELYAEDTAITLTATSDGSSSFDGWSGIGCSGFVNPCIFSIVVNSPVYAQFGLSSGTADVGVTINGSPDPVSVGSALTYSIAVENFGPDTATAVMLTDTVSPGSVYISSSTSHGNCSESGGTVTCSLGDLSAAETANIDIVVIPELPTETENSAGVSSNSTDSNAANDTALASTTVYPAVFGEVDFDGNGIKDVVVYRPSNGYWYFTDIDKSAVANVQFGLPGDIPVPADYDGDGTTEVAIYRPSNGYWYFTDKTRSSVTSVQFGMPGGNDIPVPADYDGIVGAEVAVYRPSSGYWYFTDMTKSSITSIQFGLTGDIPVPMDYDGDGKTNVAIYRPSNGYWYMTDMNKSSVAMAQFGAPGDVLVPGFYNGLPQAEIAMYRPSTGEWYMTNPQKSYVNKIQFGGVEGDIPVTGMYDNAGTERVTIYRPSTGEWYMTDRTKSSVLKVQFGMAGGADRLVPGDFDGISGSNVAVYRPSTGYWYFTDTDRSYVKKFQFGGIAGDFPFGHSSLLNQGIVPQPTPASFYFDDSSLQGWGATGLWHVSNRDASSIPYSVHYGLEANTLPGVSSYNTGSRNTGTLTSPVFELSLTPSLSFNYSLDGECTTSSVCSYDRLAVEISNDLGLTWTSLTGSDVNGPMSLPDTGAGVFTNEFFDLSAYFGQNVIIRFSFDSLSSTLNDFEGAYVDNITVN